MPIEGGLAGLDAAVASVHNHTFDDWELLVVVDGARESDFDAMRAWSRMDYRLRSIELAGHNGPVQAQRGTAPGAG